MGQIWRVILSCGTLAHAPGHAWPLDGPAILSPDRSKDRSKNSVARTPLRTEPDWVEGIAKGAGSSDDSALPEFSFSLREGKGDGNRWHQATKPSSSCHSCWESGPRIINSGRNPSPVLWNERPQPCSVLQGEWPEKESWLLSEVMKNICSATQVTLRLSRRNPWRRRSEDKGWGALLILGHATSFKLLIPPYATHSHALMHRDPRFHAFTFSHPTSLQVPNPAP